MGKNRQRDVRVKTPAKKVEPGAGKVRFKFPAWPGVVLRWGLIAVIIVLIFGRVSALRSAKEEGLRLQQEVAGWERTEAGVRQEIDQFNDPEWRENYWKWRTMSHEPGEYYIRFYENGSL